MIGVAIIVGIAISAANSGSNQAPAAAIESPAAGASQPSQAAAKPSSQPTPAGPTTLLDFAGSGISNSAPFNAPDHWKLTYDYDCANFGTQGNFQVYLYQGSSPVNILVNELGSSGTATIDEYDSGDGLHLEMNSECKWHVIVRTA